VRDFVLKKKAQQEEKKKKEKETDVKKEKETDVKKEKKKLLLEADKNSDSHELLSVKKLPQQQMTKEKKKEEEEEEAQCAVCGAHERVIHQQTTAQSKEATCEVAFAANHV
jgi:hypothetical protein